MENKVLVKLIIPEIGNSFDCFIPVNELVWKVEKLLIKSISDVSGIPMDINLNYVLLNKETNQIYENNQVIINTDIRNATELILLACKGE